MRVEGLTVRALADAYLAHARVHYCKAGRPTSRISVDDAALKALRDEHGDAPAALKPTQLEAVRSALMRPGEVCGMTVADLDRTGPVWTYAVSEDVAKMDHLGRSRTVAIGPKA